MESELPTGPVDPGLVVHRRQPETGSPSSPNPEALPPGAYAQNAGTGPPPVQRQLKSRAIADLDEHEVASIVDLAGAVRHPALSFVE